VLRGSGEIIGCDIFDGQGERERECSVDYRDIHFDRVHKSAIQDFADAMKNCREDFSEGEVTDTLKIL
jgi:hypothetical protein